MLGGGGGAGGGIMGGGGVPPETSSATSTATSGSGGDFASGAVTMGGVGGGLDIKMIAIIGGIGLVAIFLLKKL